jgi:5,10-methylenetetrahydromethanopterin reductase
VEVWLHTFSFPGRVVAIARQAEQWGFTGLLVADSQNLNADIWVELGLAAAATSTLHLGPGVTNTVTRHPAVTASAAGTLQAETGGRATLGIGRGDSALAQIGRRPVPVGEFERDLAILQGYLRGEEVQLGSGTSVIRWLVSPDSPKVPVHVAATGPKTIEAAARHAEGVDLSVGAELERLRWAADVARAAAPGDLVVGAYLNVGVDPDPERARELVRGSTAIFARFATEGAPPDGLSDVTSHGIERLASGYEKERHGDAAAPYSQVLDAEFIDRFAVTGGADAVVERLRAIEDVGIERVIVVPGSLDIDAAAIEESNARFASDALPHLDVTRSG